MTHTAATNFCRNDWLATVYSYTGTLTQKLKSFFPGRARTSVNEVCGGCDQKVDSVWNKALSDEPGDVKPHPAYLLTSIRGDST